MTPVVALVGRPNVGKSTLFNRLAGRRLALVHDRPGVTRDRREAPASLGGLPFTVVDTAGFDEAEPGALEGRMRAQTERAIETADVCLLIVDARAGITALDEAFARILRRAGKPVLLVANKCEGRAAEAGLDEAQRLGFGAPIAVSAEHGLGLDALHDALADVLPSMDEPAEPEVAGRADRALQIAVVGRPNVGKSSLINRLIGEARLLTGPEAGITRDAIAVEWQGARGPIRLFDTAGLRRRTRVTDAVERLSVGDTLRAIRFAEVVLLVIDAEQPFDKQDLTIADLILREGRSLVIVVNKWDTVGDRVAQRRALTRGVDELLAQVRGVPLVFLSALTGEGLAGLMPAVEEAYRLWNIHLPTASLNRWLEAALDRHPPPLVQGRRLKLRYVTQAKTRPPGFVLFTTRPADVPDDYVRYLVNSLREAFDMPGVPIRFHLRKGKNPYAED